MHSFYRGGSSQIMLDTQSSYPNFLCTNLLPSSNCPNYPSRSALKNYYLDFIFLKAISYTNSVLQSFFEKMNILLPFFLLKPKCLFHLFPSLINTVESLVVGLFEVLQGLHFEIYYNSMERWICYFQQTSKIICSHFVTFTRMFRTNPILILTFFPLFELTVSQTAIFNAVILNGEKELQQLNNTTNDADIFLLNLIINKQAYSSLMGYFSLMKFLPVSLYEMLVIIILRMMSELNTGSMRADCSSLPSTQTFILRRLAKRAEEVDAGSFTPEPSNQSAATLPIFNGDRRHYTPAFVTSSHAAALQQLDQQYKEAFATKAQDECHQGSFILQPKPSSTFCFVCKEPFVDYSKHINHPVHKKFLASSSCEDWISELIESEKKKRRTPACFFVESHETSRKIRKLETVEAAPTLALQYLKESSTCVSIFQAQMGKKVKK